MVHVQCIDSNLLLSPAKLWYMYSALIVLTLNQMYYNVKQMGFRKIMVQMQCMDSDMRLSKIYTYRYSEGFIPW